MNEIEVYRVRGARRVRERRRRAACAPDRGIRGSGGRGKNSGGGNGHGGEKGRGEERRGWLVFNGVEAAIELCVPFCPP